MGGMSFILGHKSGRLLSLGLAIWCMALCASFSVPSPQKLRKEIRKELEEIREMTPSAKERALWRGVRDEAEASIKKAEKENAPVYAPEFWSETSNLSERAKEYAAMRSYRKAAFLARKAAETAQLAAQEAKRVRTERQEKTMQDLDALRKELDLIADRVPSEDKEMSIRMAELNLEWKDLVNALHLQQFEDAVKGIERLKKTIGLMSLELDSRL